MSKFKYDDIAVLKNEYFKPIKIGIKFDSTVFNRRKNRSGISYYIKGHNSREWCFQEELKKATTFHKILFFILNINV